MCQCLCQSVLSIQKYDPPNQSHNTSLATSLELINQLLHCRKYVLVAVPYHPMKIQFIAYIVLLLGLPVDGNNVVDDDTFNFLEPPTQAPFQPATIISDTETPTEMPVITTSPTVRITSAPTASPTAKPTANPTAGPTRAPAKRPTKSPAERDPRENDDSCQIVNGFLGQATSETSEKVIIQYYYKMEYIAGQNGADLIAGLEDSITDLIVKMASLFPGCNSVPDGTRTVRREEESQVVGISSKPDDESKSACGENCVVVDGRLSVFLATRRRLGSVDVSNEILEAMENAMINGDLKSTNAGIEMLTYLPSIDMNLASDGDAEGTENLGGNGEPVGRGMPTYGYVVIASVVTTVVAGLAVTHRYRKNRFKPEEALSPREDDGISIYDDEEPISLRDDGSTSFLNMSGATADIVFASWKKDNGKSCS